MDTRKELRTQLIALGLERIADEVLRLAKKGWRLETQADDEQRIAIGASKFGGRPDLPAGWDWPRWQGQPLAFIAQVCLTDLVNRPDLGKVDAFIPSRGWLYFFYDAEQRTWGFDPADLGSWRVLYFEGDLEDVRRSEIPTELAQEGQYLACRMVFRPLLSLPTYERMMALDLSEAEQVAYWGFPEAWAEFCLGEAQLEHQFLGHPSPIQGDMRLECQLASHGLYCGDASGYNDLRREALEKGQGDWTLLLQVDSDPKTGMVWGDVGRLYYWIRHQDAREGAFEKAWMILQCY